MCGGRPAQARRAPAEPRIRPAGSDRAARDRRDAGRAELQRQGRARGRPHRRGGGGRGDPVEPRYRRGVEVPPLGAPGDHGEGHLREGGIRSGLVRGIQAGR